jgi:hypothetical protein
MCEELIGYSHKQAKQKTEESGLLISRILLDSYNKFGGFTARKLVH